MTKPQTDAKTKKALKEIEKNQRAWNLAVAGAKDLLALEDAAWKKRFPETKKEYDGAPKVDKGIWGDFFPEGIRDTEIHLVDSAGQKLDFRVGPVFGKKGIYKEPGIWLGVQRRYFCSTRDIELLISPEIWRRLNKEMELRFKEFNPRGYGPSKVISAKPKKRAKS